MNQVISCEQEKTLAPVQHFHRTSFLGPVGALLLHKRSKLSQHVRLVLVHQSDSDSSRAADRTCPFWTSSVPRVLRRSLIYLKKIMSWSVSGQNQNKTLWTNRFVELLFPRNENDRMKTNPDSSGGFMSSFSSVSPEDS